MGVFFFLGIFIPFLAILFCDEFDKMQIPYTREYHIPNLYNSLFGDDWSLCFCALTSVGALFILKGGEYVYVVHGHKRSCRKVKRKAVNSFGMVS